MSLARSPIYGARKRCYGSPIVAEANRPSSFRPIHNAELAPAVITSNWAYFTVATGTAFEVPADAEITFDGTTWLTANGTTPEGARRWKVRGLASADHSTLITYTPTLGGVDWPFAITTHVAGVEYILDTDGQFVTDYDNERIYQNE